MKIAVNPQSQMSSVGVARAYLAICNEARRRNTPAYNMQPRLRHRREISITVSPAINSTRRLAFLQPRAGAPVFRSRDELAGETWRRADSAAHTRRHVDLYPRNCGNGVPMRSERTSSRHDATSRDGNRGRGRSVRAEFPADRTGPSAAALSSTLPDVSLSALPSEPQRERRISVLCTLPRTQTLSRKLPLAALRPLIQYPARPGQQFAGERNVETRRRAGLKFISANFYFLIPRPRTRRPRKGESRSERRPCTSLSLSLTLAKLNSDVVRARTRDRRSLLFSRPIHKSISRIRRYISLGFQGTPFVARAKYPCSFSREILCRIKIYSYEIYSTANSPPPPLSLPPFLSERELSSVARGTKRTDNGNVCKQGPLLFKQRRIAVCYRRES